MQRSLHGDRAHPGIAATLQKLGDLAAQNGDPKQGIKFLQESLQMQRSLHGDRAHPGIAATLHKLGDLAAQSGDLKQAGPCMATMAILELQGHCTNSEK